MHDDGLRTLLTTLDPKARDDLRRVLIHDQADRDRDEAARPEAEAISGPDLQAVWVAVLRGLDDRRASPVRGALSFGTMMQTLPGRYRNPPIWLRRALLPSHFACCNGLITTQPLPSM